MKFCLFSNNHLLIHNVVFINSFSFELIEDKREFCITSNFYGNFEFGKLYFKPIKLVL